MRMRSIQKEARTLLKRPACFCQCFGHSPKTCRSQQKCLICGENHSPKGFQSRESRKPMCAYCKGPHVASYKGRLEYKRQAFRQHAVNNQKSYTSVLSQNTLPHPTAQTQSNIYFTAEQLTTFVQTWLFKSPNHRFVIGILNRAH